MIRFLLLFCFAIYFQQVNAQTYTTRKNTTKKALKLYDAGKNSFDANDYVKAIKSFQKALKQDPNFINAKVQIAHSKYNLKDFSGAKVGYQEIIDIAPNYKKSIYYQIGLTDWNSKNYEQAITSFEKYLTLEPKNQKSIRRAKQYIANGKFTANAIKNPVPYNPQRLTDNINSITAFEYSPRISLDDQSLIFTRKEGKKEDFFISTKSPDGWSEAKPLTSLNTPLKEGIHTVSADGKLFIFTACSREDGVGGCDLYYSRQLSKGNWTKPRNLGQPVNSPAWESQPSLTADGRTLYFASNRKNKRTSDIFVCHRKKKGWTEPILISKKINTPKEDHYPFIHPDGKTLYFTSNGHPGMGKNDIYLSRKQDDGTWSTPQNLGYPINTNNEEDGGVFVTRDGKTSYFSSDRLAKKKVKESDIKAFDSPNKKLDIDIYSFELPEAARATPVTYVKAIVKDAGTKKPLQAYTQLTNLSTQKNSYDGSTDKGGELLVCIPLGDNYGLHVERPGYTFHSENFSLKEVTSLVDPYTLEIFLKKIPEPTTTTTPTTMPVKSEPIILKNVFFATASAELRPESIDELTRLKEMLEANASLRIQINGHTDNVGDDQSNLTLSDNRAKAVEDFLIQNGISSSRLSHKGFGETSPIDSNDTEIGRQNNRRTEFLIL